MKKNIDSLKSQLKKAKQPLEALKEIEEKIEAIEEKIAAPVERRQTTPALASGANVDNRQSSSVVNRALSLGERVTVSTLNADGVVTALGEFDADVQIGSLRVRARLIDLQRKSQEEDSPKEKMQEASTPWSTVGNKISRDRIEPAWQTGGRWV